MNTIDLHMHSEFSIDGEYPVQSLLDMAHERNIEIISIADHNSTQAYAEKHDYKNVKLLSAIELDCSFKGYDFHLLGYGIDTKNPIYKEIEEHVLSEERNSSGERLALIKKHLQLEIDEDKLKAISKHDIYVAEDICEIAMADERNRNNPNLQPYFPGGERSDNPYVNFYWDHCSKGKPCYVELHFMSLQKAIEIFREQNAFIVLAHPGNNVKENDSLMEDIILLGIDGLEVYSSYHNEEKIAYYQKYANEYHLMMTAGSDFHGKTKPSVFMGECGMPVEQQEILKQYLLSRFY